MADENFGLIKNLAGGQTFSLGHFYKSGAPVTNPTLAEGDVLISGDYGNFANITALPTVVGASTRQYKQALTQAETDYDIAIIEYVDQTSPTEWDPFTVVIAFGTNRNSAIPTAAEINAQVDTALSDYDPPTDAEMDAAFLALQGADGDTLETLSDQLDSTPTAAAVAAATLRAFTVSAPDTVSTVSGSSITITRGDDTSISRTSLGSLAARDKIWFTVKVKESDDDSDAIIQVDSITGMLYLNGTAWGANDGSITIDDEADGDITITLDHNATYQLAIRNALIYDIQMLDTSGDITTLTSGNCRIAADVTRRLS
jgi:hypothetical protein